MMRLISFTYPAIVKFSKSLASMLMLAVVVCITHGAAAAAQDSTPTLKVGEPVEKNLAGGQRDKYQVGIEAGQYLHIVVEQEGIDVKVSLKLPDGQETELDSPYNMRGPEDISIIAKSSGICLLEVVAPNKGVADGSYKIRVLALREATPADTGRASAAQALALALKAASKASSGEELDEAVKKLNAALALWEALGDQRGKAYAQTAVGQAFMRIGKFDEAIKLFDAARAFWRETNSLTEQAYLFSEAAGANRNRGNYQEAWARYDDALKLYREAGDVWGQAWILNNTGFAYHRSGQASVAMDYYKQALPLWRSARDRTMEINTLNNIGGVYNDLGDLQQALISHEEVRRISEELGNKFLLANSYNNIGLIYDIWGESQTALSYYEKALALFREEKRRDREAITLHNIGVDYGVLGDAPGALDYLNQSRDIQKQLNLNLDQATTLTSIGLIYSQQNDQRKALEYYKLALPLRFNSKGELTNKRGQAYTLTNIGLAHALSGEPQKALEVYGQALKLREETNDRRGEAITLDKTGQAYSLLGDRAKALENYEKALSRWQSIGDRHGEALTLYGISRVERDRGDLAAARQTIHKAVSLVESLRSKVSGQQLRTTYLATRQNYYELEVDVNMRLYLAAGAEQQQKEEYVAVALQASEKGRVRSLLDTLTEAQADISQAGDPKLALKAEQLQHQIDAMAEQLLFLRNRSRAEDAAFVAKRIDALTAEYEDIQTRLRASNPRYAALTQPRLLDLSEIRKQLLDDNTLLLEYALGEERSYLWAVTQTSVTGFQLSGSDDIEKAARRLRELTVVWQTTPEKNPEGFSARVIKARDQYWPQAEELSRLLLGPVSKQLGTKRLLIVPDGILHLVPFGALPAPTLDGPTDLGTRAVSKRLTKGQPAPLVNEVVVVPSVSTLALLRTYRRPVAPKAVAVVADPVFESNDDRVHFKGEQNSSASAAQSWSRDLNQAMKDVASSAEASGLPRLRATQMEALEIIAATPAGAGMKATDFKANRALVMSGELSQYRILHFATHGLLDSERPHLSGIVLSLVDEQGHRQNGYLRLQDIYTLKLPSELVVLSACDTGLGKEIKGEGLISLTRGFMHAGARRVIASLWKVDSDATAELMKDFYQAMFRKGLPPAAALKFAQGEVRKNKQWSDPYFWAGFVFQGEWQWQ
jgi:tetratricopeptide (TPR) repeat protein